LADDGIADKRVRLERDWTKGHTFHNFLRLAWPLIINDSLWVVGSVVDMIWVGRLGSASIAGVGVAGIVVMILMSARMGLNTGARALISRFMGAGDTAGAVHTAQQAFVVAAAYASIMALIGIIFADEILALLGLQPDVIKEGAAYMRIQFAAAAAMGFWMMAEGIMLASGDTIMPMKVTIVARLVHLVLDPFLIFGWWIFPFMGVSGAAVANVAGFGVGMGMCLWALMTGHTRLRISFNDFHLDPGMIWRIVKIGIPASVMGIQRSLGNLILVRLLVPFGTFAVASHALCQRVEMVFFMPTQGLGQAAGVLIGQNLGAGQPARAERSGWQAYAFVQGMMIVAAAAIVLYAPNIIGIFNSEPDLVDVAGKFLKIAAAGYLLMGFESVLQQSISGAGDTIPPMLVSLVTLWIVQLPLAYLLSTYTDLDAFGVRWAMVAAIAVGSIAYTVYFKLGRWKRKRV
jgi:putative MATE family efflux protein